MDRGALAQMLDSDNPRETTQWILQRLLSTTSDVTVDTRAGAIEEGVPPDVDSDSDECL